MNHSKKVAVWNQEFEQSKDVISYVQHEHKGSMGYLDEVKKQLKDWIDSNSVSSSVQIIPN